MATGSQLFVKKVRSEKLYKDSTKRRDSVVRKKVFQENLSKDKNLKPFIGNARKVAIPGQMITFDYHNPIHKEELEYYDAAPVTIFFNTVMVNIGGSKEGKQGRAKRVIGFNIHYYPPKYRFQIVGKIYELFEKVYSELEKNSMDKDNLGLGIVKSKISGFNYRKIIKSLENAGLGFGVRMYDPKLMYNVTPVPVEFWSKAVLTEGQFNKQTREKILDYWKKFKNGKSK